MIDAHNLLEDLDPQGAGILVFPAFVFPLIVKLTRSFPLLSICHVPFTPLLCKPVICTEVYQKPSFSSTIVMMQLLNHCRGSLLYECPSVSYLFRMIFRIWYVFPFSDFLCYSITVLREKQKRTNNLQKEGADHVERVLWKLLSPWGKMRIRLTPVTTTILQKEGAEYAEGVLWKLLSPRGQIMRRDKG